jgi:hypothetical protein
VWIPKTVFFSGVRDPFAETTKNKNRLISIGGQAIWRGTLSGGSLTFERHFE